MTKALVRIPRGRPCREHVPPPPRHADKASDPISLLMDISPLRQAGQFRLPLLLTAPPCCGYRHALLLQPLRSQRFGFGAAAFLRMLPCPSCRLAVGGFQLRDWPAGQFALHRHEAVVRHDLAGAVADPVPIRDDTLRSLCPAPAQATRVSVTLEREMILAGGQDCPGRRECERASLTDAAKAIASPPARSNSRATCSAKAILMSLTRIFAPNLTSCTACERPSPPPAPVTIAMRPPSIKAASSASFPTLFTH